MKKNLFFIALAALTLVACEKKEENLAGPEGSVKFANEVIAWDGMQITAEIEANCAWKIVSENEFLTIKPTQGDANTKKVEIIIAPNTTNASQTLPFDVELTGANGEKKTLSESIILPEPFLTFGDVTYKVVYLKDGNFWMAENLRYVPEGAVVGETSNADATIFYPATIDFSGAKPAAVSSQDASVIAAQGYLYAPEYALGTPVGEEDRVDLPQDSPICPEGWHIPTAKEWADLLGVSADTLYKNYSAPYYDAQLGYATLDALNEDGFNVQPFPYKNAATYLCTVTNKAEGSKYAQMNAMMYYLGSTTHKAKNMQLNGGMITNNASQSSMKVAYLSLNMGVPVRLIKDSKKN